MSPDPIREIDALLNQGESFQAYDRVCAALARDPEHVVLQERLARALIRIGAEQDALDLLMALAKRGHRSQEVLGLMASTQKARALRVEDANEKRSALGRALVAYEQALEAYPDAYWFGANVASLRAVLGDLEPARAQAREVLALLAAHLDSTDWTDRAWALGTAGEAHVVLGDAPAALAAYEQFRGLACTHASWEMLASARRNALLLLHAEPPLVRVAIADVGIEQVLAMPPVAIATGRGVPLETPESGFVAPAQATRDAVQEFLERHDVREGFAALGNEADLLFHEALRERDIARCAVLPWPMSPPEDEGSGSSGEDPTTARSRLLWRDATRTRVASRHVFPWDERGLQFANEMLTGLALLEAEALDSPLVGLVIDVGSERTGPAEVESAVGFWQRPGVPIEIEVVEFEAAESGGPDAAYPRARPVLPGHRLPDARSPQPGRARIMGLLFADAKGFSGLDEFGNSAFATDYLGLMADVAKRYEAHIFERNTWGDALFFALTDIAATGRLALDLCRADRAARSQVVDLPETIELRIGLHAAPVRILVDPIREQERVTGAQISAAARIEPITPPGHVYASEAFAALSRARCVDDYRCRYVGLTELAKNFGREPVYVVER